MSTHPHPHSQPSPHRRIASHALLPRAIRLLTGTRPKPGAVITVQCAALLIAHQRLRTLRTRLIRARYDANHDRLTGLPNRAAALARLEKPVGMVGFLDLDAFKDVNDRHGHQVGDRLLIAVADRLTSAIGRYGHAYRLSGDEFVLIWHRRPRNPLRQASTLLTQAMRPLTLDGHTLHPSASLGLALPGRHLSGIGLIAAADTAMYEGKHHRIPSGPDNLNTGVHLYARKFPPTPTDRRTTRRRVHAGTEHPERPARVSTPDRADTTRDDLAVTARPARSRSNPRSADADRSYLADPPQK